jgi:Icc-related predicted phosphoesterase
MKIAFCSDLHLEFGDVNLTNNQHAEVLLLCGDICIANRLLDEKDRLYTRTIDFFERCAAQFSTVLMVMGNHEHYNGNFIKSYSIIQESVKQFKNVFILEKQILKIGSAIFIGGTLWTDMNCEDSVTMIGASIAMNDFYLIKNGRSLLKPQDVVEDHRLMLKCIKEIVDQRPDDNFILLTHHAPTKISLKPGAHHNPIINGAYSSDLEAFMRDRPQIKTWVHGHTHDDFDYRVGSTRVLCNPRGYPGIEDRAEDFQLKYFEV